MSIESLSRWQFAITTVYHFFFVPLTVGLVGLVAGLQTAWYRTGQSRYLRLTHFFGKLFLINFALGVVTGIVQEFQFGMNWSEYSRFVGDVFGAPLALEGLLAFFAESTFLGLWIFGWDRLPPKAHLACIWLAAIGSTLSAYFILAANSWMQNPVGYTYNETLDRAELTDVAAVFTNPVLLTTFPHQIFACYLVGGAFVLAVAVWHLVRGPSTGSGHEATGSGPAEDRLAYRTALKLGSWTTLVAGAGVAISGDFQGKVMYAVQPMKMAAAEALYDSEQPGSFSLFTLGTLDGLHEVFAVKIPYLLSFLATGDFRSEVLGINQLQAAYQTQYGPGVYSPNIPLAYWSFRMMITLGMIAVLGALVMLWLSRRGGAPRSRWWVPVAIALPLLPLLSNSFGWIFTETGRQPWLVFGLLKTEAGVSPGTSITEIVVSLVAFTLLYGTLAVIEAGLLKRYIVKGLPAVAAESEHAGGAGGGDDGHDDGHDDEHERPLAFAY